MSLRNSKPFKVVSWSLTALVLGVFAINVVLKVWAGKGGETYVNVKGMNWHYSSALVVIVEAIVVLVIGLSIRVWRLFERDKSRSKLQR